MSEENKNLGGPPKKAQQLRNKVNRQRMKAVEVEISMLEGLVKEVHLDWAQLKLISDGDVTANPSQMKAIHTRLERFWKYIEKSDIDEVIDMLDEDYVAPKSPDKIGGKAVQAPRLAVFKAKSE